MYWAWMNKRFPLTKHSFHSYSVCWNCCLLICTTLAHLNPFGFLLRLLHITRHSFYEDSPYRSSLSLGFHCQIHTFIVKFKHNSFEVTVHCKLYNHLSAQVSASKGSSFPITLCIATTIVPPFSFHKWLRHPQLPLYLREASVLALIHPL